MGADCVVMVASGRKKMKGEVNSGKVEKRKREGGVIGRDGGIVTKKLDVGKRVTSFARAFASSQRKVRRKKHEKKTEQKR